MIRKIMARYSAFDLIVMALMACLGVAIKPLVVPLAHIITGPLFIPGGVVAGGFYMLWLVLGAGLVGKHGTGTVIALVQAIMVVAIGFFGTHGIASLATYVLPGIAVDLVFLLFRQNANIGCCFFAGIGANIAGSFIVNLVFFRLPLIPLVLSLSAAALSGGLGGLIAYHLIDKLRKFNLFEVA